MATQQYIARLERDRDRAWSTAKWLRQIEIDPDNVEHQQRFQLNDLIGYYQHTGDRLKEKVDKILGLDNRPTIDTIFGSAE